jgi:hypothetical protein
VKGAGSPAGYLRCPRPGRMKAIEIDGSAAPRPCRKATSITVAYRLVFAAWTSPGVTCGVRRSAPAITRRTGYWITSSAVANSVWGMVRPRAVAVLRLMTNWSLRALLTGRSPGFWPLRMRPA